jgi:hypothetical protein
MNLFGQQDQYGGYQQPHAAAADPETSHEAAINMEVSGKLNRHCEIVLGIIRRQSGTYPELWEAATPAEQAELGDKAALQKRISDLLHRGAVKRLPKRACRINKNTMRPVEAA